MFVVFGNNSVALGLVLTIRTEAARTSVIQALVDRSLVLTDSQRAVFRVGVFLADCYQHTNIKRSTYISLSNHVWNFLMTSMLSSYLVLWFLRHFL